MQKTAIFKTILILGLVILLIGVDGTPGGKGKKEGKAKPRRSSQRRMRKMWLSLDTTKINLIDSPIRSTGLYMSPWTYTVSYDASRIPSRIFEAQCENKGCLTEDGHEDYGLESKPILYQILVLKRTKGKKKYSLQLEQQTIKVGCTCTLPNVISQK